MQLRRKTRIKNRREKNGDENGVTENQRKRKGKRMEHENELHSTQVSADFIGWVRPNSL
jgi:hypothetical protein